MALDDVVEDKSNSSEECRKKRRRLGLGQEGGKGERRAERTHR